MIRILTATRTLSPARISRPEFITGGCVLELKMDEGEGVVVHDSSGYGNHGDLKPGPAPNYPSWVDGYYGKALSFDGVDDYVEVIMAHPTGEGTHSAWIKLNSYPPAGKYFAATMWTTASKQWWHWAIKVSDTKKAQGRWYDGSSKTITGVTDLSLNTWYQITITAKNNDYGRLFVSGIEEGTPVAIGTLVTGGDRVHLSFYRPTYEPFNGLIPEVYIYSFADYAPRILERAIGG